MQNPTTRSSISSTSVIVDCVNKWARCARSAGPTSGTLSALMIATRSRSVGVIDRSTGATVSLSFRPSAVSMGPKVTGFETRGSGGFAFTTWVYACSMLFRKNATMVAPEDALPGRTDQIMPVPDAHFVNGNTLTAPFPDGMEIAVVGMGCFWGAERIFWQLDGVFTTFVGYAGGFTPNCTYEENCTGLTGHAEAVGIVFDPDVISFERIMQVFWEEHDTTQTMRQGNDIGSQYRTGVWATQDY